MLNIPKITQIQARGCGWRVGGGAYIIEKSFKGENDEMARKVIMSMIPCPVIYIEPESLGLSDIGMKILPDANGTYHLWDIVGTGDYPYPSDFIEEAIRMGISRRIPQSLMQSEDFKKLRGDSNPVYSSRHIMVHRRAIIVEMDELYKQRTYRCAERGHGPACPQGIPEHDHGERTYEMCAALWWEAVGHSHEFPTTNDPRKRLVSVPRNWKAMNLEFPSLTYWGDCFPAQVPNPTFLPGVILSVPIEGIEVIEDVSPEKKHEKVTRLLQNGGWNYPFSIVEE